MLQRMDLSGTWQVRSTDHQRGRLVYAERDTTDPARYRPATVPGEIHLDLMKQGAIADVYRGAGCLAARWVEEQVWSYRREFDAPAQALEKSARAWLYFEGLDYAAQIVLNGTVLGTHANFFRPCRLEITGKLRPGRNVLTVHLDSGLYHAADKPGAGYSTENALLHKRHWLRKPQCQFSWDWSTRLINVGIHGRVWLEHTRDTMRVEALAPLAQVSDDLRTGYMMARVFAENLLDHEQAATLELELVEAGIRVTQVVALLPGLHAVEVKLVVNDPKLWWPVGHGEQPLYTVRATLRTAAGALPAGEKRVGFRHVRIQQGPHPQAGSYFVVEINGKPIFCKGGNMVPADMVFAAIDRARYVTLIERALEANYNFLRVWGGGIYESDVFYELCDEKGILVWQEFIFACSRYPTHDAAFHKEVSAEARYQIRRLANHPSLIVWCGNNENEGGLWEWGWMEAGVIGPDHGWFHITLPRLMQAEDPTRYYQPTSPWSGRADVHPYDDHRGDQHPWTIGFTDVDFRKYRQMECRFPNEGGILGPTSLPTILEALSEGQRFVQSFDWQLHDNSIDSFSEPSPVDQLTEFWLGRDCRKMKLEEYAYWGGVIQAEGLREYIDNFRRRMFDSAAAIFWMFNDCWPAVRSWTIVDYSLRRTPSFYPVRRAFAPIRVVVVETPGAVEIFGINETAAVVSGELHYGVFNLEGGYPVDRRAMVSLPPNQSTKIAEFGRELWGDPVTQLAFATLSRGGELLTRNRLILPLFKDLRGPRAEVSVRLEGGRAVLRSPTFAFNVCLDLEGTALPDNFFDVYPGVTYVLPWTGKEPPKIRFVGDFTAH